MNFPTTLLVGLLLWSPGTTQIQGVDVGKMSREAIFPTQPDSLEPMPSDKELVANSVRMEYLFETTPKEAVMDYFISRFPKCYFTLHPTMNGFYARGPREDLLSIKREIGSIDIVPEPLRASDYRLEHLVSVDAVELLRRRAPQVQCEEISGGVLLTGPLARRQEASDILSEIDRPSVWLRLPREALTSPLGDCRLPPRDSSGEFTCPKGDCGGRLHSLGLRQGDKIHWDSDDGSEHPFWTIRRADQVLNIYVDFY